MLLALSLACATRPPAPLVSASDGRYAMGTALEITLHGRDAEALDRALDESFAMAARLDHLLSRYDDTSDVSRLNRSGGVPLEVDPAVVEVLRASVALSGVTGGAFDVTVGPLVALWTQAAAGGELPGDEALEAARERVGSDRIEFRDDGRVVLAGGAQVDLGGVAKGYALDRMRPILERHGVEAALLSFGQSSVWAVGAPPDSAGWRLLVRAPGGGFDGLLTLRDQALSVSGSLGQGSVIGGRRFGHVLDPRSGWPLTRRREAVVVSSDATLAEALSVALLVLGEGEGMRRVAEQPGCEALLLDADGRRWATPGFVAATRFEALPEAE